MPTPILITYLDSTGATHSEYVCTQTGALQRVEELEAAGYSDILV